MPLDIPSLPSANQVLRYAKASYDFDRDGGDPGLHSIPSQQVPASAMLAGHTIVRTVSLTSAGTSTIAPEVGSIQIGSPLDSGDLVSLTFMGNDGGPTPSDGSYPIALMISGDALTAGAFTIYVWYVL
jgi:hypothetical protein